MSPAVSVCGWCKLTSDLDPHTGIIPTGPQVCKLVQIYIFRLSYKLTSDDLWPWFVTSDHMNIWRFPYYTNKPSLVQIGLPTFQMKPFSHFQPILQLDLRWPLTLVHDLWLNIWRFTYVTQSQLMRLFAVKLILSYEQKCKVRSKFVKK